MGNTMPRTLLAAALLALGLAAPPARAAEPVHVALVAVLSGPQATLGRQIKDGFQLGLDTLGGKLGGAPVELTVIDDEMKPDNAVNKLRGALESQKTPIVVGPVFSNILAAILKPAIEGGAILISPNAGPSTLAGKGCSPYFFSTSYQNDQVHAVLGKVAQDRGYKRVVLLAPNYQAGRDAMAGFKRFYKGEVADELYVPLTQMDFQSELARIAADKPDAVFAFMPGGLGINLVKQYRQAGLANIPFLSAFTVDESVLPAEGDAALGFYSGANWAPDMNNPASKAFVAAFEKAYGYVPGTYAAQAFDTALLLNAALTKTGGDASDREKLRAALETAKFDSVRGDFRFGVNHYPIQNFYLAQVAKRPDGKYQTEIRELVFKDEVDPYAAECRMK
ncbi:MAG: ABC transporter substrate-binding protein [Proteobacteria bacterium]|nr:ABC transporter substrate-binding protein [Pseudomonadota bacterium]